MNGIHGPVRARRLALLLGTLLHLAGAAALPFHAWTSAVPGADGASIAERQDGAPSQAPHDEVHCVLCHAAGSVAEPAAGPVITLPQAGARAHAPTAPDALPRRPAASARARAPPLA